jgi:GH25 family lysozyme M1 (1,4-beta-N-acetylmuramidase)
MYKVIDISDWQEGISFQSIVDDGINGVIIKITEGTSITDNFHSFLQSAKEYNLPWGVYCYAHAQNVDEATEEANEVLYILQGEVPPMGIWYDVEDTECFEDGVDTTAVCSAFIVYCNAAGYKAGIYTSSLKCTAYMTNSIRPDLLADYVNYWIADYRGYNGFKQSFPYNAVAGWQYTESYNLDGKNVDMSYWYAELE